MTDPSSHDHSGEAMARQEPLLPYDPPPSGSGAGTGAVDAHGAATTGAAGTGSTGIRVGDRERDAVAEQLRVHLSEGRLTLDEFDERLGLALGARTRGDLDPLLADLPDQPSSAPVPLAMTASSFPVLGLDGEPVAADRLQAEATKLWFQETLMPWLIWNGVMTGIWAISAVASGSFIFFWPIFPIFFWGIAVALGLLKARTEPAKFLDDPDNYDGEDKKLRRRLREERELERERQLRRSMSPDPAMPPPPQALPPHNDELGYRPLSGRQPEPEYRRDRRSRSDRRDRRYRDTEDR